MGHAPAGRGRARLVGAADHGQQAGQAAPDQLGALLEGPLHDDLRRLPAQDGLGVGDLGEAQLLGDLWADLGGVAVDGLPPAEDQVKARRSCRWRIEGVGGGLGVGAGELAVGEQDDPVGAAVERLAQTSAARGGPMVSTVTCRRAAL